MKFIVTARHVPSYKKNKKLYAIVIILILIIVSVTTVLAKREEARLTDYYNRQVMGLTTASTKYLVNRYNLYFSSPTIKHKTLVSDFLSKNVILKKFQISDANGEIIFDSSTYEDEALPPEQLNNEYLEFSRKSEPTYIYDNRRIGLVISPYFEDWGSHKYTVIYEPSFIETSKYISQFKVALVAIAILLAIVVVALISIFVITEQYRVNRLEKKKLEIIDGQRREFLMLASHNLRTPLTLINGHISLLAETKLTKGQLESMVSMNEAAERLGEIVENILMIASIQEKDSSTHKVVNDEKIAMQEVISEILEKNTVPVDDKSLSVNVTIEPKDLTLIIRKNYLTRMLNAIITNAIKFNKKSGKVNIDISEDTEYVHIIIADTGVGIKGGEQKNAYSIFHRSSSSDPYIFDYEGAGIGLYMSKLLVEQLGGDIRFESMVDKGTTFYINLPRNVKG